MSLGTCRLFDSFAERIGVDVDLSSDSFKMLLCSSGYTPNQASHSALSDVTSEVSGAGYTRQTLQNVAFSRSGATCKFDADNPVFAAAGGSITARYWVVFDDSLPDDPLVCYGLIDDTPADVTITDGNTLTIAFSDQGLFSITRQ